MTRIDFYLLPGVAASGLLSTAAKLCEKASLANKPVYVFCADAGQLASLDDLLWTHRQGSFTAHERYDGRPPEAPIPQVLLGTTAPPDGWHDVLINLSGGTPDFFSRFERLCELVDGDEGSRAQSRQRYRFYRDRGYELNTMEQSADGSWVTRS